MSERDTGLLTPGPCSVIGETEINLNSYKIRRITIDVLKMVKTTAFLLGGPGKASYHGNEMGKETLSGHVERITSGFNKNL